MPHHAFHVFMSSQLKNAQGSRAETFKEGGSRWKNASPEEKEACRVKAAAMNASSKADHNKLRDKLRSVLVDFKNAGLDTCVFLYDREKANPACEMYGDGAIFKVLKDSRILSREIASAYTCKVTTALPPSLMREKVRAHLNLATRACPGMGSCFPYKEVHKKEVKAHGWPEGVNVRDPSSMGKKDLLALLNATITLEKCAVDSVEPAVPGVSGLLRIYGQEKEEANAAANITTLQEEAFITGDEATTDAAEISHAMLTEATDIGELLHTLQSRSQESDNRDEATTDAAEVDHALLTEATDIGELLHPLGLQSRSQESDNRTSDSTTAGESGSRKRSYYQWEAVDTKKVESYFKSDIQKTGRGVTGSLPGIKEIQAFLTVHDVFCGIPLEKKQKVSLVRSKIFNERKKFRSKVAFDTV
ncbi:uncharacterized protein [Littorina saxatilis]|uniref:uncharacterized protein isoform X1 n=1 Tax=Littorina saxatilis TaxID=31220 RepID=UPI0038B689EA